MQRPSCGMGLLCSRGLTEARALDRNEQGQSGGRKVRDMEGLGVAQV